MNVVARCPLLLLLAPTAAFAVPGGSNGNAGCQEWVNELVVQMADPVCDVRLRACRAARSWKCGPGGSQGDGSGAGGSNQGTSGHKLTLIDVSVAPDPFSPEPDTFLDYTALSGIASIHATNSLGSNSPFEFELRLAWSIRDARGSPIREIESTLPIGGVDPGKFFELPFELVWNGAVGTSDGPLAPDGVFNWTLVADLHRLSGEAIPHPNGRGTQNADRIVASVTLDGTVAIDGTLGETLRADLEESLLARLDDSEIAIRRASLASLALIGRDRSVTPLLELMRDETANDPFTRGLAAMALGGLVHVTSDPDAILAELLQELPTGVATYRSLVARALGRTHDLAAVPELEAVRVNVSEPALVRGAADQAINRIERMFLTQ